MRRFLRAACHKRPNAAQLRRNGGGPDGSEREQTVHQRDSRLPLLAVKCEPLFRQRVFPSARPSAGAEALLAGG